MRYCLLFLYSCVAAYQAGAQGENNVWTFGHHNGLNFVNAGAPPVFFQSSNESLEGCASISDAAGDLLFYSNGNTVWNAAGTAMPNGAGILGNGPGIGGTVPASCAQGVAIVRSPATPGRYYLFVLDAAEDIGITTPGYLRYSVVDMSLNGGTGDVVPGLKNIIVDSFMSEKMTIVKGAGCYYWLLTHRHNSPAYYAYKISVMGISPPVISNGSWTGDIGAGQLKVSPDGTKIASCTSLSGSSVEVGTFDNATGMISNTILIDPLAGGRIGTCFSPDNSKLYISMPGSIAQYDLTTFPNAGALLGSKVVIAGGLSFSNLRNGPDGKIYIAFFSNHSFIGVINNPNNQGMACNIDVNALVQPAWATFPIAGNPQGHGLGNDVLPGLLPDTTVMAVHDTPGCAGTGMMTLTAPGGGELYLWNDGSQGQSRVVTEDGVYWSYRFQDCHVFVDTYKVTFIPMFLDLGPDTAICAGSSIVLDAGNDGAVYRWQDGSSGSSFTVTGDGSYWVKVSKDGCSLSDTVQVGLIRPFVHIKEQDTLVCSGQVLVLHAEANTESAYTWNEGSTGNTLPVHTSGSYAVTATNSCGAFTDSVHVSVDNCDCPAFIPNAFTPNNDQRNDVFTIQLQCSFRDFSMSIYNRFGQRVFYSKQPDNGWDGRYQGMPADAGTYFYYVRFDGPKGDAFTKKGDLILIR